MIQGRLALLSVVVVLGLGATLVACGGGDDEEAAEGGPGATQPVVAGEAEFEVEQDDYYFKPAELQAKAGSPVQVELENGGGASHTFTIDELGVDQVLGPGEKATVEFTPNKDGTFAFYCRFHRAQGMEGELQVSAPGGTSAPSGFAQTPAPSGGGYNGY